MKRFAAGFPAHSPTADALKQAGREIRKLERQLAAYEADGLIEVEAARQFATLLDLIDDHLGLKYLPDDLSRQLGLIGDFLGIERRRS